MIEIFFLLAAAVAGWSFAINLIIEWRRQKSTLHLAEAIYVAIGASVVTVAAQAAVMRSLMGGR